MSSTSLTSPKVAESPSLSRARRVGAESLLRRSLRRRDSVARLPEVAPVLQGERSTATRMHLEHHRNLTNKWRMLRRRSQQHHHHGAQGAMLEQSASSFSGSKSMGDLAGLSHFDFAAHGGSLGGRLSHSTSVWGRRRESLVSVSSNSLVSDDERVDADAMDAVQSLKAFSELALPKVVSDACPAWTDEEVQRRVRYFPSGLLNGLLCALVPHGPIGGERSGSNVLVNFTNFQADISDDMPLLCTALRTLFGPSMRVEMIVCTSETVPSDLYGGDECQGPLFADMLIVHNIHLLPPRTHAFLLQAMRVRRVLIDSKRHDLPAVYCVLGTHQMQNFHSVHRTNFHGKSMYNVCNIPRQLLDEFVVEVIPDVHFFEWVESFVAKNARAGRTSNRGAPSGWKDLSDKLHAPHARTSMVHFASEDDFMADQLEDDDEVIVTLPPHLAAAPSAAAAADVPEPQPLDNGKKGHGQGDSGSDGEHHSSSQKVWIDHPECMIPWKSLHMYYVQVNVSMPVRQYVRDITVCLRQHARVSIGPSLRGFYHLIAASKVLALLSGEMYVRVLDVDGVAPGVLAHRLVLRPPVISSGRQIVSQLVTTVLTPPR